MYHLCSVTCHIRPRKFICESVIWKTTGFSRTEPNLRTGHITYTLVKDGDQTVFSATGSTPKMWARQAGDFPDLERGGQADLSLANALHVLKEAKNRRYHSCWQTPEQLKNRPFRMDNGEMVKGTMYLWILTNEDKNEPAIYVYLEMTDPRMVKLLKEYLLPLESLPRNLAIEVLEEFCDKYFPSTKMPDHAFNHLSKFFFLKFKAMRKLTF